MFISQETKAIIELEKSTQKIKEWTNLINIDNLLCARDCSRYGRHNREDKEHCLVIYPACVPSFLMKPWFCSGIHLSSKASPHSMGRSDWSKGNSIPITSDGFRNVAQPRPKVHKEGGNFHGHFWKRSFSIFCSFQETILSSSRQCVEKRALELLQPSLGWLGDVEKRARTVTWKWIWTHQMMSCGNSALTSQCPYYVCQYISFFNQS